MRRIMKTVAGVVALTLLIGATGCADQSPQRVENASVRLAAVPGNPSAAYFTLKGGPVADRLMSVSSPLAVKAEMHDMSMAGGMMKMAKIEGGVDVAARGTVTFAPSGKHVMLFDVSPRAAAGRTMPLVLRFASGATIEAQARIQAAGDVTP